MPDAKNLRALCDLIEDGEIFPNIEKIYTSSYPNIVAIAALEVPIA